MLVTASWPRHLRSCIGQYLMPWSLDFSWFSSGLWRTWSNYWHLRKNHQVSLYFKVIIRTNRINLPSPRSQWRNINEKKGKYAPLGRGEGKFILLRRITVTLYIISYWWLYASVMIPVLYLYSTWCLDS